jgi:hypothetical protein
MKPITEADAIPIIERVNAIFTNAATSDNHKIGSSVTE